jgi:hypothetical protein
MKRTVKLTERDLSRIVKRVIRENEESKRELQLKDKLDNIFFGEDESNITSEPGERGFLSKEYRLTKKISPKQRVQRIEGVIEDLENYINDLRSEIGQEQEYEKNPTYDEIWGDIEGKM